MLTYSFSNMAAAQKAREALKAQGFKYVSLDITDRMHTDSEFSQDYGFTADVIAGPTNGSSNNFYVVGHRRESLAAMEPFVLNLTSDEHGEYKTRLIVDEGDGDPKQVDKIVAEYISLA